MSQKFFDRCEQGLADLMREGRYKTLKIFEGPVGATAPIEGLGDTLIFCANDYLGLANHPEVVAAARAALEAFGAGTASARFICGSTVAHRELETALARFLKVEAALTYSSAFAANNGVYPALSKPGDVIFSDELNHASIIDGLRLCHREVKREIYKHSDMADLEARLKAHQGISGCRFIVSDGVFSMEGDLVKLDRIVALARAHDAVLIIDDAHGLGVLGETGRGIAEHYGLMDKVDVYTGTLGKTLGGISGGFAAGPATVVDSLLQFSRPHIFSNAIPVSSARASLAALRIIERQPQMVGDLREKVGYMRGRLKAMGIQPIEGESGIIPVLVGETHAAIDLAQRLLQEGLYVVGFGFPVVPEGTARLRIQVSGAHTRADIDRALAIIERAWPREDRGKRVAAGE
ncbi:MAG: aminotransferase class I/II-fold pyridoxal phosphate-dependent enzyme [Alphaproteobacteria bacterium]|nr:aminotransferase class I/II-fold pyridoxal phosphate-dependent enzyme [Alphaproteobacteria bacterium]